MRLGCLAGDACRSVRVVDDRAGVSNLAAHAAGVSRGVRQRHPPCRWLGSRLLPLLAAAGPALFLYILPHWWLIAFPILLLVAAVLVSDILWEAATRDF